MKREQPASDHARQVHLMVKKRSRPSGAFWDQEGASCGQEGAVF